MNARAWGRGRGRERGDRWVGCMGGMTDEVAEHVDNATGHEIFYKRPAAMSSCISWMNM